MTEFLLDGNVDHTSRPVPRSWVGQGKTAKIYSGGVFDTWDSFNDGYVYINTQQPFLLDRYFFTDTKDHWVLNAANCLVDRDILTGYQDGNFHPDQEITRA